MLAWLPTPPMTPGRFRASRSPWTCSTRSGWRPASRSTCSPPRTGPRPGWRPPTSRPGPRPAPPPARQPRGNPSLRPARPSATFSALNEPGGQSVAPPAGPATDRLNAVLAHAHPRLTISPDRTAAPRAGGRRPCLAARGPRRSQPARPARRDARQIRRCQHPRLRPVVPRYDAQPDPPLVLHGVMREPGQGAQALRASQELRGKPTAR